jgi:hypothetical protein
MLQPGAEIRNRRQLPADDEIHIRAAEHWMSAAT